MQANGEACDEVQFHDVVKKPTRKLIQIKETDKEVKNI